MLLANSCRCSVGGETIRLSSQSSRVRYSAPLFFFPIFFLHGRWYPAHSAHTHRLGAHGLLEFPLHLLPSPVVSGSKFARSLRFTAASLSRLHIRIWYIIRTWYHTYVVVLCTVLASEKKATRCPRALPQQHSNLGFHKETGSRREVAASGLPPQACGWASRGTSDGLALGRWGRSTVWCGCSS